MATVTGIGGVFSSPPTITRNSRSGTAETPGIQLEPWGGAILKCTDDKGPSGNKCVVLAAEAPGWQGAKSEHSGTM